MKDILKTISAALGESSRLALEEAEKNHSVETFEIPLNADACLRVETLDMVGPGRFRVYYSDDTLNYHRMIWDTSITPPSTLLIALLVESHLAQADHRRRMEEQDD